LNTNIATKKVATRKRKTPKITPYEDIPEEAAAAFPEFAFFPELLLLNTFRKLFIPEFFAPEFFPLLLNGIRLFTAGATEFTAEFVAEFTAETVDVAAEFTAPRAEFTAVVSVLVAELAAFVRLFTAVDANVPVLNIELILP
jgi:hypothetical protein